MNEEFLLFGNSWSKKSDVNLLESSALILRGLSNEMSLTAVRLRPVKIDLASSSIQTQVSSVDPILFLIRPWKPTEDVPMPPDCVTITISPLPKSKPVYAIIRLSFSHLALFYFVWSDKLNTRIYIIISFFQPT